MRFSHQEVRRNLELESSENFGTNEFVKKSTKEVQKIRETVEEAQKVLEAERSKEISISSKKNFELIGSSNCRSKKFEKSSTSDPISSKKWNQKFQKKNFD